MKSILQPKIGIIGAGPCGLTAAKNLLMQGLTNIIIFEKSEFLGGNWVFDETAKHSSVYETTHIISSKRLSQFDDFPMPADYPDYPSHRQLLLYFQGYAKKFNLTNYIRYSCLVQTVRPYAANKWQIFYQDSEGEQELIFDYLLVANGHHSEPFMPAYPGEFAGELMHSKEYKKALPFKDKRVLIVGAGNSACDMAVEIARTASKTCISMRKGQHIFPKFIFGKPTDVAFAKIAGLPLFLKQGIASLIIRIIQGRYSKYKLQKPMTKLLEVHPTINSELLYFIRHGKIEPCKGIHYFDGQTVHFMDGMQEDFDTIIFATGYKTSFPFFDKDVIDFSEPTYIPLYRKMMHANWDSLYFIGLFQPQGCIWSLADYQAKIVANIIAGKLKRPTNLTHKIDKEISYTQKYFAKSTRHALEVDFHQFRRQLLKDLAGS